MGDVDKPKRIFLVEDEEEILDFVTRYLQREGFATRSFIRGDTAWETLRVERPDLLLLDIMLPGLDGMEILRRVRSSGGFLPVILLTSKMSETDRIVGLELGADDYITKPFSPGELVARVKALFRRIEAVRSMEETDDILKLRGFQLNLSKRCFESGGLRIDLTTIEFSLLKMLLGKPGRIFTRDELLSCIWGDEYMGETRTVDVHVKNLRKKIKAAGGLPDSLRAVWGVGYTYED